METWSKNFYSLKILLKALLENFTGGKKMRG